MTAWRLVLGTALIPGLAGASAAGFDAFYNLDYERAVVEYERDVQAAPGDAMAKNHLAQALLYRALLRADALDSGVAMSPSRFLNAPKPNVPAEEKRRFLALIDESLRLTAGRPGAPDLYAAGVAHIHRAYFELFINKAWRAGLRDATAARELHQRALQADPAWGDARVIPAMHDYVLGSLPWYAKAIGFLAGYRGDKAVGIAGVEWAAANGVRTKVEAQMLLAVVQRREGKPARAAEILAGLCRQFPRNYLYRMERIQALVAVGDRAAARAEYDGLKSYANLKAERRERFGRSLGW